MLRRYFFATLIAVCFAPLSLRASNVISFNFDNNSDNSLPDYFQQTDVAGAPGERVAHWNTLTSGDGNGVFSLGTVHDSTGTTITGMTLTTGGTGTRTPATGFSSIDSSEYGGTHSAYGNDSKLFDHFLDYTSNAPVSITVTNIPYKVYSVVFYRSDEENSNSTTSAGIAGNYVGGFSIGTTTQYVRGGPSSGGTVPNSNTPNSTGSTYIFSSDTTDNVASTKQGNAVQFSSLTATTLTASLFAGDSSSAPDTRVSGFQIVDMTSAPEPVTMTPLMLSLFVLRRRSTGTE